MTVYSDVLINPGFESGDTGWIKGTGWTITTTLPFEGSYSAQQTGAFNTNSVIENEAYTAVTPGTHITYACQVSQGGSNAGHAGANVRLYFYDTDLNLLSHADGAMVQNGVYGTYSKSTGNSTVPPNTAYMRIAAYMFRTSSTQLLWVDSFEWDYENTRVATLTSPTDGSTYSEGDAVLLSVTVTGTTPPIESVEYFDGVTSIAVTTTPNYSYNVTTLTPGAHSITAQVTLVGGTVLTTDAADITISAAPPDEVREFKASNSYSYLIAKNFFGLGSSVPSTARVTGVELILDYSLKVLTRSKDLSITDPLGSNPNVAFDITNGGIVEAVLLTPNGDTYDAASGSTSAAVTIDRADFDISEEGTSEGKKWTVFTLTTPTQVTLGDATALFGLTPIAAAEFLDKSIGLRFYPVMLSKPAYADSGDTCIRFLIDKMRLRVYFDAGSADYYFASADKTQVIKGTLVASCIDDGNFSTGDASGDLQLTPDLVLVVDDDITTTQTYIADDWTIHASYPPDDANQIGTVATREADDGIGMAYNGLPSTLAIRSNRSRYEFITANFFAVRTLDSIYGVHGLPRAFAYNGDFFYKICTQPDPDKDQPRHLAYSQGHLALGFDDGRVDISVIGQPYNFDGAQGASEWSIGDKVTGLLPLSGTILGIFGSKSIWGLSGTTVDNFATQVITPNIGAIEYTVTDMGFPVYANAYGIYTLAQTQAYGDYLGTPMSQDISPWLRPRLVRKYTSDKEVVVAWPVRSKNQYRLAFADGYVMSMTLNAGQQSAPTFSFQQYTIFTEEDE